MNSRNVHKRQSAHVSEHWICIMTRNGRRERAVSETRHECLMIAWLGNEGMRDDGINGGMVIGARV